MSIKFTSIAIVSVALLSGCVGPEAFETEPVRLPTAKGDVYCQLYTLNSVTWDRSISHPDNMSIKEADRLCFELGYELAAVR